MLTRCASKYESRLHASAALRPQPLTAAPHSRRRLRRVLKSHPSRRASVTILGQLCLLAAFIASGYAAFSCLVGWKCQHRLLGRAGIGAGVVGVSAADASQCDPGRSVATSRFPFRLCAAQYSSRLLPWYYALSTFWVGQAGSLLFWAWSVGILAMIYRFWPRPRAQPVARTGLRHPDDLPMFPGGDHGVRGRPHAA